MRALTETERYERKDRLAEVGLSLLAERGWQALTIEKIARRAGVAKGTVFLSFSTKEGLFLHGLRRRFEAWFERLAEIDPAAGSVREWAERTLQSLRQDTGFLPLLSLSGPVLEQGASSEAVVEFKTALARGLELLASKWGMRVPQVSADRWRTLFLRVYAIIIGSWAVGEPPPTVREVVAERPELAMFDVGFDVLFVPMLEAQLASVLSDPWPE